VWRAIAVTRTARRPVAVPGVGVRSPPRVNAIDAALKDASIIAITNARIARA
jgi:hypothetical protein